MAAAFALVPVSPSDGGHDFEIGTFDAIRAANGGFLLRHEVLRWFLVGLRVFRG